MKETIVTTSTAAVNASPLRVHSGEAQVDSRREETPDAEGKSLFSLSLPFSLSPALVQSRQWYSPSLSHTLTHEHTEAQVDSRRDETPAPEGKSEPPTGGEVGANDAPGRGAHDAPGRHLPSRRIDGLTMYNRWLDNAQ